VTTISGKTTKNNSDKNKDESSADSPYENTSDNDSDSTSESSRTTVRHTTNTTRNNTNIKTTNTTTMSTSSKPLTTTQTATTEHNGFTPFPQTTTITFEDNIDIPSCTEPPSPSDNDPPDYTVKPSVRYYPDDNAIDISDFTQNDPNQPSINGPDSTSTMWEDFMNNSDIILIATVNEIIYTGIDGVPYTQENISVSEVIKGDIEQYSRISVYGTGGYIPASEYGKIQISWAIENNCMLFDPANNKSSSQVGDRYLYFIRKSDSPLPDGSYRLTTYNDMSKFRYTDGYYVNMNNNNLMFTLTELYDLINN
ncbi:MAG: hypothetical protein K2O29_01885, partial [Ruminococcus sp.]|nr:hypothetical protein [Ruminococcus sp.]